MPTVSESLPRTVFSIKNQRNRRTSRFVKVTQKTLRRQSDAGSSIYLVLNKDLFFHVDTLVAVEVFDDGAFFNGLGVGFFKGEQAE